MKKNVFMTFRSCLFFILSLLLLSCARTPVSSLNQEGVKPHLPGKFVWYDLFTNDLSKVADFYKELFGWEFAGEGFRGNGLKTIRLNGTAIANAVEVEWPRHNNNASRWLGYVSVNDVDLTVATVEAFGGKIHTEPKEVPHRGRIAVCIDPQGAVFAVVRSSTGDPVDKAPVKHQLIGSELWTNDLDAALSFYHAVAGYIEMPVLMEDGATYRLLAINGRPRAGMAEIMWEDVHPNWVPYIVVENVEETVKKAQVLGGKLLLGLRDGAAVGAAAILSDPTGGIFGVQQIWVSDEVQP